MEINASAAPSNGERSRRAVGLVGAACLVAALFVLFQILWPLRWSLVAFWVTVEVIFYIFYWRPRYAELDAQPKQHRPASEDAMAAFSRMLQYFKQTKSDINYEMYYSGWFLGAKFEDIKRGNAEEFLAYAFWYRTMEEMQVDGLAHVPAAMLAQLEETWGLVLQPGYTPGLKFMGHLWEPLKAQWRPLAFYLSTAAVGWFATVMLKRWGFVQASHQGMAYFTLNMWSPGHRPHGMGLEAIKDLSSANLSDMSTAAGPATPPSSAEAPPAVQEQTHSAPALPAMPAAPHPTPEVSALSSCDAAVYRSKSSPFQREGLNWAARLTSDAEHLAASISMASAVHFPEQPLQATGAVRRSGSSLKRRMAPPPAGSANNYMLTPRLSAHTSALLRASLNPLEEALSDDLANNDMPVLFLHGVGGIPAYLEMLLQVMALGHPVIVVQCPGVAMRLGPVLPADQVVEQVVGVLDKLGVEQACVIGHSYGTFIAGRLARLHSERVRSLCLIDPVCFGMFMPQLLGNFLYSTPPWRGLHHIVDYLKKGGVYMASHELHVCATFSRSFFWTDLNLWPEDLAPGSVVLLSGRDDLMNAQQVKAMLEEFDHIKVHYNHDLTHGEFLIKSEVKQAVIEEVRTMLRRGGSAVVGLARPVLATTMTLACSALGVGSLGAGGVVRLHTAGDGAKYVEDHTNQLVRTFTGNLTAMLHQVNSIRPTFDTMRGLTSSGSGGSSSRSRLSVMAGASSTVSASSSADEVVQGEQADKRPQNVTSSSLSQAMSVPVKNKSSRQLWLKKIEQIQEQASVASSALESSGSNNSDQLVQQAVTAAVSDRTTDAHVGDELLGDSKLKGGLEARAAARRSSGSGGKVLELSDGLEVPACPPAEKRDGQQLGSCNSV